MTALDAPGAVAFYARGVLHLSSSVDTNWIHVSHSPLHDLTPTYNRPWLLTSTVPNPTAAGLGRARPARSASPQFAPSPPCRTDACRT